MHPLFEISHVTYSYHTLHGEISALSNVTFGVLPGEFIAIVGPSGCGKSTLLNLLAGMLTPDTGEIHLNGNPLNQTSRSMIGYMLQQDHLLEWRSIFKNVLLGLEIRHIKTPENINLAHQLLKQYGLEQFADARPSQLSGGMRQRAALVRTLVLRPDLLLLDEPFSALDYQTRLSVSSDIGAIIRKEKKTAILVTHDLSEAVSLADRILIMSSRPGHIRQVVSIDLPDTLSPLARREHPSFSSYFHLIWEELNHEKESRFRSSAAVSG